MELKDRGPALTKLGRLSVKAGLPLALLSAMAWVAVLAIRSSGPPPFPKEEREVHPDPVRSPILRAFGGRPRLSLPPASKETRPPGSSSVPFPVVPPRGPTVAERNAFYESLSGYHSAELFSLCKKGASKGDDPRCLDLVFSALSRSLVKHGGADGLYDEIGQFLANEKNDLHVRSHLVRVLGEAPTLQSLAVLLSVSSAEAPSDIRDLAIPQLVRITSTSWDGQSHPEFTDLLAGTWGTEPDGSPRLAALGIALARIGTTMAVDALLGTIEVSGKTVGEFETTAGQRGWVAFDALREVANPEAIGMLGHALAGATQDHTIALASGYALVSMGNPDATSRALEWVRACPGDVHDLVEFWVAELHDEDSILLAEEQAERASFVHSANREALQRCLERWRALHPDEPE